MRTTVAAGFVYESSFITLHGIGDDVDRITLVLRNREQLLIAMLGTVFASVCHLYSNIACTHSNSWC